MFVSLSVIAMGKRKVSVLQKKKKFFFKFKNVWKSYKHITLAKLNKSNIAKLKMGLVSMKCFFNPARGFIKAHGCTYHPAARSRQSWGSGAALPHSLRT